MYVPTHFLPPGGTGDEHLAEQLRDLLARAPLADLITHGARPGGPVGLIATPLPLLYDADRGPLGTLVGHVARNNPHWQLGRPAADPGPAAPAGTGDPAGTGAPANSAAAAGTATDTEAVDPPDSLVILRGPDAYISPTWYASTAEHGRVVPTWNYLTAHVSGHLVTHDDEEWTFQVVRRLTEHFETGFTPPWTVDDPPAKFIAGQLRAIVGIEVVITSIQVKHKLGQNRSAADVDGAVAGLSTGTASDRAIAAEMATLLVNRP
jgi:transcriptional regulator